MEHATIIQLGSFPETTGVVESATFEEAFGEYSNLFGKKARARRAKRKASRRSDRLAKKKARRDFKAQKRSDRRAARMANVKERTEMRKARRGQRATARQETRDLRKRGRQERRIMRRADRKRQRQDMRDEQQQRRQARRDIRKSRRLERKNMGDQYEEQPYLEQGYDDQGYGLGYDDQGGYDDYGYDQGALPAGDYGQGGYDDYGYGQGGYDDYGYDQGGFDQGWGDDYGYDQVGAANPYTSGSIGGGSPYADLGYEEQVLPEFETGYGDYGDYYDEQPNYDYGYDDYGYDQGGYDDYGYDDYGNDFGQDFYFDGGKTEDEGLFMSETDEIPLDADVLDRAVKIEWNKELISKLKEKGKNAAETGAPEKTGILNALKNRLERLSDLEAEESDFSNASGRNAKMVRKAKGLALGKRMKANPRFKAKMLAKLKSRQAGTDTYRCCCEGFAGGGDSTVPCDQLEGFGVCKSCGGLAESRMSAKGMNIRTTRPTVVSRGIGAQMSPQKIVIPAERSSGMSGTNALDWENRTSPTGEELPLEVVELSSNADGKLKGAVKKINWLWVGVGVAVAAGTIFALHKYKVIK